MRGRSIAAVGLVAIAVPAIAVAEGLPPHSSYFSEHAKYSGHGSNVGFLVRWRANDADIYASDNCLGESNGYANEAMIRGVKMRNDRLNFNGKATVYEQTAMLHVAMRLSSKVSDKKITGTIAFPKTAGCSERSFTAHVTSSRK